MFQAFDLSALLNDAIRYVHLLAVTIGLGASFFADFTVLQRLKSPLHDGLFDILHRCHGLVWGAIICMWASGLVLIYLRTGFVLDNVTPKLFAKLGVVSALTLNAYAIGAYAMPRLVQERGAAVLSLPMRAKLTFATIAAISTTSWLLALALGSSKVLAQSGQPTLLLLVGVSYVVAFCVSTCTIMVLRSGHAEPALESLNSRVASDEDAII